MPRVWHFAHRPSRPGHVDYTSSHDARDPAVHLGSFCPEAPAGLLSRVFDRCYGGVHCCGRARFSLLVATAWRRLGICSRWACHAAGAMAVTADCCPSERTKHSLEECALCFRQLLGVPGSRFGIRRIRVPMHTVTRPPEKLDAQMTANEPLGFLKFLRSLLLVRRGWFANHALPRTTAGRRGCHRRVSWPLSLSLGCSPKTGVFRGLDFGMGRQTVPKPLPHFRIGFRRL